jgi:hypothetical protein
MPNINITNRFLNENKRYSENVVVTVPSIITNGGGRSQAQPMYLQGGDTLTASVLEQDTIVAKAYLIVDEVFPVGALGLVTIGGVTVHTGIDLTATGMTVSVTEDTYLPNGGDVVVTVSGITGDVTTGKLRVVLATEHPKLNNGQYAN